MALAEPNTSTAWSRHMPISALASSEPPPIRNSASGLRGEPASPELRLNIRVASVTARQRCAAIMRTTIRPASGGNAAALIR